MDVDWCRKCQERNEKGAFSFHNCKNEIISYKTYTIKSASYNNKD